MLRLVDRKVNIIYFVQLNLLLIILDSENDQTR